MERNKALAARLREVFLSGRWIANTNYKDQLTQVSMEEALERIHHLNTIAALTYHINYYVDGVLKVLQGGPLDIKDQYSFDLPEMKSESDWNERLQQFFSNAEKLADEVEQMEDARLDQVFVDEKYGNYLRNIEAILEHSYYHLGQIVLIRKWVQQ